MNYQILDVTTGTAPVPAKLSHIFWTILRSRFKAHPSGDRALSGRRLSLHFRPGGRGRSDAVSGSRDPCRDPALYRSTAGRVSAGAPQVTWSVARIRGACRAVPCRSRSDSRDGIFPQAGIWQPPMVCSGRTIPFWQKSLVYRQSAPSERMILGYPVITSGKKHTDSPVALLGDRYNALVEEMSLEHQVSEDTPPTFLWHTETDELVPVEEFHVSFEARTPITFRSRCTSTRPVEHGLSLANEETIRSDGTGIVPAWSWIGLAAAWVKRL